MKKLSLDNLLPGMITAEDIYDYSSQLILNKGQILTQKSISKLQFYAIAFIRVEDEMADIATVNAQSQAEPTDVKNPADAYAETIEHKYVNIFDADSSKKDSLPIPTEVPEQLLKEMKQNPPQIPLTSKSGESAPQLSHSKKLQHSKEFRVFKAAFHNEVQNFRAQLNAVIQKNAPLDTEQLLDDALKLISTNTGTYSIFDMLQYMCESDDTTYSHCLNVGLFCHVFSGWIHLSEEETRIATLSGLLCDIGKIVVPESILKKRDSLTTQEFCIMKKHSLQGYLLLKDLDINPHIKHAALMHHERYDGSGYPFGLSGDKIDPYARLVAIADAYNAMTSPRPYRRAISPIHAIEIMMEDSMQKYDTRFIMVFLENVMNSFIGNTVHLSNGKQGEIVFVHKDALTRPVVKCGSEFIDLKQKKNVQILEII